MVLEVDQVIGDQELQSDGLAGANLTTVLPGRFGYRRDHVREVTIVARPQPHQVLPGFRLVVLHTIPIHLRIAGKD